MKTSFDWIWVILGLLALSVPAARGQQTDTSANPPVGPYPPVSASQSNARTNTDSANAGQQGDASAPTSRMPLTSIEEWAPGSSGGATSFLSAGFDIRQGFDSNPAYGGTAASWTSFSQLSGHLELQRMRRRSEFTLDYNGYGNLYAKDSGLDTTYHTLGVTEKIDWRRWTLLLIDSGGYSTNSTFGAGPLTGATNTGTGVGSIGGTLNSFLNPSQSIFSGLAGRISNTAAAQLQYAPSARSTFTATGSYGILHFLDTGFVDSNNTVLQAGYNYSLRGHDTFAVNYSGSLLRFSGTDQGIDGHSIQLGYGRRVTGRFSLQVFAGPRLSTFRNTMVSNGRRLSWTAQTLLRYGFSRSDLTLSYFHGITSGSGIFLGSQSNEVRLGLNQPLSRRWQASWDASYGRNSALLQTLLGTGDRLFNFWTGSVRVGRQLGSTTQVYIQYRVQRQTAEGIGCTASNCGNRFLGQEVSIGFSFNARPMRLE